jgi:endonuclease YncB( thermonuclease family)
MGGSLRSLLIRPLWGMVVRADPIEPDRINVLDGDTIRLAGIRQDVRLVGFNAPETTRARCAAERALGDVAERRLRELVRAGNLDFALVRCSCRPGTAGTSICNRGRKCGTLKVKGRDVGDILIAERLAVPFVCGEYRCPRTPRPWC